MLGLICFETSQADHFVKHSVNAPARPFIFLAVIDHDYVIDKVLEVLEVSCFQIEIIMTSNVWKTLVHVHLRVFVSHLRSNDSLDRLSILIQLNRLSIFLPVFVKPASLTRTSIVLVDPIDQDVSGNVVLVEPASHGDVFV